MKIHSMVQEKTKGVKEYVAAKPVVQHPILMSLKPIAWQLQNYNMNLFPTSGKDSLFLTISVTDKTTEITKILENISRDKLLSIILASWVTKYDKLRAYPQPLKSTDDSNQNYLKRPPKTTFYIPIYNPSDDLPDVKDPRTILRFLNVFTKQHDSIKNFNPEDHTLIWSKCLFS
ncbi:hypothetical protein FXO38_14254 [Capsicum annuum]|nr:hypothetical protein FXO37_31173 [Capsicum annuum]KAF3656220.1 hypothetical protein FXO38_14254 [Capsicum annuum]